MELDVQHVEVWEASIADQPGGLAHALDALDDAGIDIQLIVARRDPASSGGGKVLIAPVQGTQPAAVARDAGFHVPEHVYAIKVSGQNRSRLAVGLPSVIAGLEINLLGFTASTAGHEFVAYIAVDSRADAEVIVQALRQL